MKNQSEFKVEELEQRLEMCTWTGSISGGSGDVTGEIGVECEMQ